MIGEFQLLLCNNLLAVGKAIVIPICRGMQLLGCLIGGMLEYV